MLESKIRLCKLKLVSDCPPDWKDNDIRTMCRSYMGTRFFGNVRFRNAHCAYCNEIEMDLLSCQPIKINWFDIGRSLSIKVSVPELLDVNEGEGDEVGRIQMCENGQVYDSYFQKCRNLECLPGYVKKYDFCVLKNSSIKAIGVSGSGRSSIILQPGTEDSRSIESGQLANVTPVSYNFPTLNDNNMKKDISTLKNCPLISLADEDYIMLPNKSVYVPNYNKVYEPASYYVANSSIFVCCLFTSNSETKFLPVMGYVTTLGFGTSMICLLLHFIAFWMVPDLQNLSGKSLVSQCLSLFCAYACCLIDLHNHLKDFECSFIEFCTFYFFQVAFFWMGIIAYDVWRALKRVTTELRVASGKQLKRFIVYSLFTWVTPLLFVSILVLAELTDFFPLQYRPAFAKPRCWFKRRRALMVFFAAPLFLIMFSNLVLFTCSSRMILMTSETFAKEQNQVQRRTFKLYLRLALLMGLTWIIGIIAASADIELLWYIFVIFNSLQGLFIFIAFTCTSKVGKYLKDKLRKAPKG
ncbi:g-protein coupled receptor Mth2 [Nephila pilipes]|uniref:G-protein coupled receptor Mth2 n=1 Tax=Nephila pilipes TaxID=299642 RepID=A0A8X6MYH6_NEPPI|nr:g-protein coupled receptor Mth2 [Nephila pilipes]GFT20155.1 g-protein coupled receptor Mth2 [Nephila pilipes]